MTVLRSLASADAAAWLELRLRAVRDHPTAFLMSEEEELRGGVDAVTARFDAPHERAIMLGAFEGSTLLGYVGVVRADKAKMRHCATIWGMYVVPEQRRRGLAGRLLAAAIDAARAMPGVDRIALSVDEQNNGARELYQRAGFVAWGTEPDAFRAGGRSVDEAHMVLRLDSTGGSTS
jgi:ribosomal protein S18 acetylase RimI-like enzyme